MTNTKTDTERFDFFGLGIAPKLLKILEQLNFTVPTPIQYKSIPVAITGQDVLGIAQTGTGKTLAFGIPMLQRLATYGGRGLVVLPTRELAIQVDEHLRQIGEKVGLRTAVLIGGESKGNQIDSLRKHPHIIVATPGRLIDFLEHRVVSLKDVKILVLDEADLMFDMGFEPQITRILESVPRQRQTMLFSATMPPEVMKIVAKHLALPIQIEVAPSGTPAELIIQEMIVVHNEEKFPQLEKIIAEYAGSILIFTRTKYGAKKLCARLRIAGQNVGEIHSNRSPIQRREALSSFKNGRLRILVATDIAARGIDVKGIELVVNYDLPDDTNDYVHRIGRTGRAGKTGRAISFVTPAQISKISAIERLIKINIPVKNEVPGIRLPDRNKPNRSSAYPNFSTYKSKGRSFRPRKSLTHGLKPFDNLRPKSRAGFNPSRLPMTDRQKFRRTMRSF